MAFFNKKEEVIDIKITQFGKDLLSRGAFKPVFYQFFDDDIIYNSAFAGFTEHQNDTESRILENTPKLKTQALTTSVERQFKIDLSGITLKDGTILKQQPSNLSENTKIVKNSYVQDRILLYPLASQEVSNQSTPTFTMTSLGAKMEEDVIAFIPELTGSGILIKIPQINISASFSMTEYRDELFEEPVMVNTESFFDLSSRETIFADGSKISVYGDPIIIDLEELNVFFGLDNFELEIYEITEKKKEKILTRIDDLNDVNKLFHIKTDVNVEEVEVKTGRKSNYYRSREN